jgi:DNA adenine methylase
MEYIKTPILYAGGKTRALKQIEQALPRDSRGNLLHFKSYVELFVDGGSVFFHLKQLGLANKYWINDKYTALANFWQAMKNYEAILQSYHWLRQLKADLDAQPLQNHRLQLVQSCLELWERGYDDKSHLISFFLRNRCSFSGSNEAGGLSIQRIDNRFTYSSIDRIKKARNMLKDVRVTDFSYEKMLDLNINEYETGELFMFLDQPYSNAKKLYGKNGKLHEFDHERLAHNLRSKPFYWLMTYNSSEEIINLYKSWAYIQPFSFEYSMTNVNSDTQKTGNEVFISNYPITQPA